MGLLHDVGDPAGDRPGLASRLLWGALLAWLSPVILAVVAIGLVAMSASRGGGLVGGRMRAETKAGAAHRPKLMGPPAGMMTSTALLLASPPIAEG